MDSLDRGDDRCTRAPSPEDEPIPLSALQHWAYCPRQCALIHLEQVFDDNLHTLRGNAVHAKVDQPSVDTVKGRRVAHALPVWHDELGLIGKADVVEFTASGAAYPVEYKLGNRHKAADIAACDDVQLAAQGMCLESMLQQHVPEGAIFYANSKRRRIVEISEPLRQRVRQIALAVRDMFRHGVLPPPLSAKDAAQRCKGCSLQERCMPWATDSAVAAASRTQQRDLDD